MTPEKMVARFWAKVRKSDGCWEWIGSRRWNGYGYVQRDNVNRPAHRYAWELTNGPIPVGMLVCHRCDNPPCVRPDHLFLGTPHDNMQDMMRKGRQNTALHNINTPRGEKHSCAKLNWAKVAQLRAESAAGATVLQLSRKYGVSERTVGKIIAGRLWASPPPRQEVVNGG